MSCQSHQATRDLAELDDAYMDSHWNLLNYFGHIKVLSLDPKAERFLRFTQEMEKIGMTPADYEVVLGVKGETLDTSGWVRMDRDKYLSSEELMKRNQGRAGCFMTHYLAIKETVEAYKKAQEQHDSAKIKRLSSVLIIEDNTGFGRVTGPDSATLQVVGRQFRLAMKDLGDNWDMFYFVAMLEARKFTENLAKLEFGLVTKCYAINARMYDRVLEALEVIPRKPVDHVIASLHKTSNCYVSTPPLAYRFASESLVGGKGSLKNWQDHVIISN